MNKPLLQIHSRGTDTILELGQLNKGSVASIQSRKRSLTETQTQIQHEYHL